MKNKFTKLIPQKLFILINIAIFVNVIMVYASYAYFMPLVKHTFYYLLNHPPGESYINAILDNYGTDDSIHSLIFSVVIILHSFFLTQLYSLIMMTACALIAFRSVFRLTDFFLRTKSHKLHKNTNFIQEVKLISLWVFLYSTINLAILSLGIPDFWYYKLAILSQGLTFYFILIHNSISYSVIKNKN